MASAPTLEGAVKITVFDVTAFLQRKLALSFPDAYRLVSATCDIQIRQVVNDLCTVRAHCPKFNTGVRTL